MVKGRPDFTGSVIVESGDITISGDVNITNTSLDVNVLGGDINVAGCVNILGTVDVSGDVTITSGTVNVQTASGINLNVFPSNVVPVDCTDPAIVYTGSWTLVDDDFDAQNGTYKYSSTLADKLEMAFAGVGVRIRFRRYSDCGQATITLNGTSRTVDTYNATVDYRWFTFFLSEKGVYTLTIAVAEVGQKVEIDSITILNEESALDTVSQIQEIVNVRTAFDSAYDTGGWLNVVDLKPVIGVYYANPADLTADGKATAILMDIKRRAIVRPVGSQLLDLKQKATTGELQGDVELWGGTQLTGRDISLDFANIQGYTQPIGATDKSGASVTNLADATYQYWMDYVPADGKKVYISHLDAGIHVTATILRTIVGRGGALGASPATIIAQLYGTTFITLNYMPALFIGTGNGVTRFKAGCYNESGATNYHTCSGVAWEV